MTLHTGEMQAFSPTNLSDAEKYSECSLYLMFAL
jgi:hypothetical protein